MPFAEGWAQAPGHRHLWHYFRDGVSLCYRRSEPVIIYEENNEAKGTGRKGVNGRNAECRNCAWHIDHRADQY